MSNDEPRPPPPQPSRNVVVDNLTPRIKSGLETVRAWDDDPSLLAECRTLIPFHLLAPELHHRQSRNSSSFSDGPFPPRVSGFLSDENLNLNLDESVSEYVRPDDVHYEGDELLLKRLTLFFQKSVMTWVNSPDCVHKATCGVKGSEMKSVGVRGPVSVEEREGGASRVELYHCPKCDRQTTTFPRYNSPRKLHETRLGRCGEYANLFGLYCRSVGFDTRYVSDYTDHVWVEVYSSSSNRWIMADSCEGKIDVPSMYERGWGKKLSYVVGMTVDSVVDVTRRYTRNFDTDEFQRRRREVFGGTEADSDAVIAKMDAMARSSEKASKSRIAELERRAGEERSFFVEAQKSGKWPEGEEYREGRISGSLAWRTARREVGGDQGGAKADGETENETEKGGKEGSSSSSASSSPFHVESFHPDPPLPPSPSSNRVTAVTVAVIPPPPSSSTSRRPRHDCIVVSSVPCAASSDLPNTISVVVIDETRLGCVLQSRSFDTWKETSKFVDTVPDGRIIALCGAVRPKTEDGAMARDAGRGLGRLGGFHLPVAKSQPSRDVEGDDGDKRIDDEFCVLYVGQTSRDPRWSICRTSPGCSGIRVRISPPPPSSSDDEAGGGGLRLRVERSTVPRTIRRRLPDEFLTLREQTEATGRRKREAFLSFVASVGGGEDKGGRRRNVAGYVTKKGSPVYLFDKTGFPLRRFDAAAESDNNSGGSGTSSSSTWSTFHYLPSELVPKYDDKDDDEDCDEAAGNVPPSSSGPKFDVPIDESFFSDLLGPTLLSNASGGDGVAKSVDTISALRNSRLVALYFSAHWCPPCRRFTPLLIEMYEHLKEEVAPNHGLEIVFVSSDRDPSQFSNYFGTMPWTAIPYDGGGRLTQQRVSARFGIRGIPALIVLDSLSGRIVVSAEQSRSDVSNAARLGDVGIRNLFERWIATTPQESQAVMESLELSCEDASNDDIDDDERQNDVPTATDDHEGPNPYLVRSIPKTAGGEAAVATTTAVAVADDADPSVRIKELFATFVSMGIDPTSAAAKAIETVAAEKRKGRSAVGECGGDAASSPSTTANGDGGAAARGTVGADDAEEGEGGGTKGDWSTVVCLRCVAPPPRRTSAAAADDSEANDASSSSRPSKKKVVASFNDFNAFEENGGGDGFKDDDVEGAPRNVTGVRLLRRHDGVIVGVRSAYSRRPSSSRSEGGDDDVRFFGRRWVAPSISADDDDGGGGGGGGDVSSSASWVDAPSSGIDDDDDDRRRVVAAVSVTTTDVGVTDLKLLCRPSRDEGGSSSSSTPPPEEEENDVDNGSDDDDGEDGRRTFVTEVPRGHELIGFHGAMNSTSLESIGLICACAARKRESKEKEETNERGATTTGKGERSGVDEELEYGTTPEIDRAAKRIVESNDPNGTDALKTVASTAKRYLSNVVERPSEFRYRSFRVGNKVFDRIAKVDFGIELLSTLGFEFRCTDVDFVASIPLATDLDRMNRDLDRILERCE